MWYVFTMKYQIVQFENRCGNYVNRVYSYVSTIIDARNHVLHVLNRKEIDKRMLVEKLSNVECVVLGGGWKKKEVYASWKRDETGEYFLVVAVFQSAKDGPSPED